MDGYAHTVSYFDNHIHSYPPRRLRFIVRVLNRFAEPNQSLVDIGCGVGNVLAFLKEQTQLSLCGIDASQACLKKAAETACCETILGSITDDEFVLRVNRIFDYAILAAVLHHVVGPTRRESRALAIKAIDNSFRLLKPGGMLFILEPTFTPKIMMDLVFWIKRGVTTLTSERVGIAGSRWNNIGAPVVSYYASDELKNLIPADAPIIDNEIAPRKRTALAKFVGIRASQTILCIKKPLTST
jgi:SAM-dependent methyltransferase